MAILPMGMGTRGYRTHMGRVDFPTGDALLWGKHNHQLCQFETKSPQNPATKHNHQLCRFCQVASWISIYGCRKVVDSSANGENARKVAGLGGYLLQIMYQTAAGAAMLTNTVFWGIICPALLIHHYSDLDFVAVLIPGLVVQVCTSVVCCGWGDANSVLLGFRAGDQEVEEAPEAVAVCPSSRDSLAWPFPAVAFCCSSCRVKL
ncbi:hypothetical protein VPH35_079351 [Triticum aestivum]|uniref:Uncharacterized protein n=1 Tax=Aegilops tauschii TaxID=37682 RepID=N1QW09_AEGTA